MIRRILSLICLLVAIKSSGISQFHPDNLTSTSIQSDKNGNQIQNYLYSAFGQSRYTQSTNLFKVSRRYTGQVLDEGTGLYYYNARYYDPNLGRFTQPDDIIPDLANPQSYNRYAYCVNNPLRYTDPTGHEFFNATSGDGNWGLINGPVPYMNAKSTMGQIGAGFYNVFPLVDNSIHQALRGVAAVDNAAGNVLHDTTLAVTGDQRLAENSRNLTLLVGGVGEIGKIGKLEKAAATVEKTGSVKYHYTSAPESSFKTGLREQSSVTDNPNLTAKQAVEQLGVKTPPNKVIPIQDNGNFIPNKPAVVERHFNGLGGGKDFTNPQRVPPEQIRPSIPIKPEI